MENRPHYILSIDVEDYFQVEAFAKDVRRADWEQWPSRVVNNTLSILDLCDEYGSKATYFVLGWVAKKFPQLVREIHARGHELACHSFWHRPVYQLTREEFLEDLRQARGVIEQTAGVRVVGYRAPTWSITAQSAWALDVLADEGFAYDSSIYPIRHDLYGVPGAGRFPYEVQTAGGKKLKEFPPMTVQILGTTLPAAGGGYLRILPFWYTRWALQRMARVDGRAIVVYLHPWEVDPEQPRIAARAKSRFRHYTNLKRVKPRLRSLLSAHRFESFRQILEPVE